MKQEEKKNMSGNRKKEEERKTILIVQLEEENKRLREQLTDLQAQQPSFFGAEAEKYEFILRSVDHSMGGEFLNIGVATGTIRTLFPDSHEIKEECDLIERSLEYIDLLLQRLFNYLDMGRLQVQSINALELVERTEWLARPRLPSGIRFEVNFEQSAEKQSVSADFEQLIGVLLELIQNAASALREKGGNIELRIESRKGELFISVEDDGPGIPDEIKGKLFKEQVSSEKGKGRGLGLFLSSKVISAMGGRLELHHSSKRGTVFTILMPTIKAQKRS